MENLKRFEEIEANTKGMMEKVEAEKAELTAKIGNIQARKEELREQAQEAFDDANLKQYHKVQDEIRELSDACDMYQQKLNALNDKPLISREQYDQDMATIVSLLDAASDELCAKIINAIDGLMPEVNELSSLIQRGNDTLATMKTDILKDERALKYGVPFYDKYLRIDAISFMTHLVNGSFYKNAKERNICF